MGQLPEALRCHNKALALKPDIPEFLCAKGATLIYLNQADEALECFQRAETLSPNMKDALGGINWALRSLGRFEEADNYTHKLRAVDPVDPRSYTHVSSEGTLDADELHASRSTLPTLRAAWIFHSTGNGLSISTNSTPE
jgi:tetratricopeptide (TPR) repeat protein